MWKTKANSCNERVLYVNKNVDNQGTYKQPMLSDELSTDY